MSDLFVGLTNVYDFKTFLQQVYGFFGGTSMEKLVSPESHYYKRWGNVHGFTQAVGGSRDFIEIIRNNILVSWDYYNDLSQAIKNLDRENKRFDTDSVIEAIQQFILGFSALESASSFETDPNIQERLSFAGKIAEADLSLCDGLSQIALRMTEPISTEEERKLKTLKEQAFLAAYHLGFSYFVLHGLLPDMPCSTSAILKKMVKEQLILGFRQWTSEDPTHSFKVLPILNRLNTCSIHNIRTGQDKPVHITRPCLYAVLTSTLSGDNNDHLMDVLLRKNYQSEDNDRLIEYFISQAQNESNKDRLEWRELSRCVSIGSDKYFNISLGHNIAATANESEAIDCLYRTLDNLSRSSLSNHQYMIDQTCLTLSKLLNSLSSHGYYQQGTNNEEVIELRRRQLFNCVNLLLDQRCSSPDYLFALIEKDVDGDDLVDGLDKHIVHGIVLRYFEFFDSTKGLSTIGHQYLEWCSRNKTIFPQKLVTELICFDLPLWEYFFRRNRNVFSITLFNNIFSKFRIVPTDIVDPVFSIPAIERDQNLLQHTRKVFFLFSNKNSWTSSGLYGFFIAGGINIPEYYECIAKMVIYILNNPASFRDNGNEHNFNKFIQYILDKTTNRSWLYQYSAFRDFNRWDNVIINNQSILEHIKNRHKSMYMTKLPSPNPTGGFGTNVPSTKSLEERISSFNQMQTSISSRKKELFRLLNQILREWNIFTPLEQEKGVNFAQAWIDDTNPNTFGLALRILDKVEDTTDIRLQKLKTLAENGHSNDMLSIDIIKELLTPEITRQLLQNGECLVQECWQRKLIDLLLAKRNMKAYLRAPACFPTIDDMISTLCKRFSDLPEALQIKLIYSLRKAPERLKELDFSLLSFEDPQSENGKKPINVCFALWRFYHEIEGGKNIRLGSLSMKDITLDILYDCFTALLTSNQEVGNKFNEEWNNTIYHIAYNTREHPLLSANICAFAAYKILGTIQYHVEKATQFFTDHDKEIDDLGRWVFSHPCLYNLMTDIMNYLRSALLLNSGLCTAFPQITDYIRTYAADKPRQWFDTGIYSKKNDHLEDIVLDAMSIYVNQAEYKENANTDPDLIAYIQRGQFEQPFCPSNPLEPIVVVEDDGGMCAIEKRKTVCQAQRFIKNMNENSQNINCAFSIQAQKLVYGDTFVPEKPNEMKTDS